MTRPRPCWWHSWAAWENVTITYTNVFTRTEWVEPGQRRGCWKCSKVQIRKVDAGW